MNAVTRMMHDMNKRPEPGQQVTVWFKGGKTIHASATRIVSDTINGVFLYSRGRRIDESSAVGWWPK